MSTYFTSLNKIWQELDLANDCNWSCTIDCERYRARIKKERIYDFLAGLNKELDEVRCRLLGIKPLPVIEEIFAEVRREETRKHVMLGGVKTPIVADDTNVPWQPVKMTVPVEIRATTEKTTTFGVIIIRDPITVVKTAGS